MRYRLYGQLLLLLSTGVSMAQSASRQPRYTLQIYADGLRIDPKLGMPVLTKTITLKGRLTPESRQHYPLLEPEVLFEEVKLSAIRYGRKQSGLIGKGPNLPTFFSLSPPAYGDIFLLELIDVRTRTKQGVTRRFEGRSVVKIPFYSP